MDGFEVIRRAALGLHDSVAGDEADPLSPVALVAAAAAHLDLKLIELEKGDPALKNARAVFDEQSGAIFHEAIDDPVAKALLIAHEIGHVELHAGAASCAVADIDPARSIEAAPVGLQRVEDYGAHERRELQANLFAREFVLPREVAKRLHIEDELTAQEITTCTKLPSALVRQQLFDALLLPQAPELDESSTKAYVARPDPAQERAAAHRGAPFQLQAGPGTGKTRTLVTRITSLLEDGIDPSSILVLTFSNRAASELTERLVAAVPNAASRIWLGTFHAFGLDVLRRHYDKLGLSANPLLFDRSDAIEVLEEILPTLPLVHYRNLWDPAMVLRDVVEAISRAKDELADPSRYRALAEKMASLSGDDEKTRIAAKKCLEIADIYDLYERALRDRAAVDFGDLIMRPAHLLEEDSAVRTAMQLRHRHILVDEYQDVNRASARLLKTLAGDGKGLWVVGDARQSIYRFRGASSANMAKFAEDYPGAVVDQLAINYRSSAQIVDSFIEVASRMGASEGMLPLALEACRGSGPAIPQICRYDTLDDEIEGVAASVREIEHQGVVLRDQAVLCRSNRRLDEIANGLEARGIPVLHLGSLFEREEIRELLALLSLVVDPFGDALIRIVAMPRYGLSLQDLYIALQHLRNNKVSAIEGLNTLSAAGGVSVKGAAILDRLAHDYSGIERNMSPWEFLATYLLDRTDLARLMGQTSTVAGRMQTVAVWQFLNFVREQSPVGRNLPIQRVLERVRQLVLLAEERDLRQVPAAALHINAVRLMTVHGSKGLEFEAVHVPGLTVSSFPSSNRGQRCPPPVGMIEGAESLSVSEAAKLAHKYEEECLFFVASSRAKSYLRFHLARKQPNGSNRSASPFLGWLPLRLTEEVPKPAALPLPDDAKRPAPITVKLSNDWQLTDSRLTSYEKCPRRFFYTHILGLGNARKTTAFSRTHDCLYDLLRWLADARRTADPNIADAEAAFEEIWRKRGPIDHAFEEDYRRLALRLVGALIRSGAGQRFRDAKPLVIDFANGKVSVLPNELAERPDGTIVVRRVRTGYRRSDEYDRLEYTLYQMAAEKTFGSGAIVQAVHLTDETVEDVEVTATKVSNRRDRSEAMLAELKAGWFPAKADSVSCPRCPHFFICAAAPEGTLKIQ